jgi:hypothetical protein
MASNKRISRAEVVRSANERPKGWMPPNSMHMNIDLGPDIKLRWIRKYFDGSEEDKTSLFKRLQRGWVMVKPEEVPELSYLVNSEGNIQQSGCVLMKIDKDIADLDVQYYEQQALGAYQASKKSFENEDNGNSAIRKFSESGKPSVFRGRQPA